MKLTEQELWKAYLSTLPEELASTLHYTAWHFCDNEADANELAELVLAGVKRGTASSLWTYEVTGDSVPVVGERSVILDWSGNAKCIIQTTHIDLVPYGEVTEAFAAIEGEGDKSLAYWRAAHDPFFTRECERLGLVFNESMPVICEQFEVVYKPI